MFKKLKSLLLAGLIGFSLVNTNLAKSAHIEPFCLSTDPYTAEGLFNSIGCFSLGSLFFGSALSGVVFDTIEDLEVFVKLSLGIAIPSFILGDISKNPDKYLKHLNPKVVGSIGVLALIIGKNWNTIKKISQAIKAKKESVEKKLGLTK